MDENEMMAGIRIIGAVARADGKVTVNEMTAFRRVFEDFDLQLPCGASFETLLWKDHDLDSDLAAITTPVIRKAVFETAHAMGVIDGEISIEANAIVTRMRSAFDLGAKDERLPYFREAALDFNAPIPILDVSARYERADAVTRSRASMAAVCGALQVPIVSDLLVYQQYSRVAEDVAAVWGDRATFKYGWGRLGILSSVWIYYLSLSLLKLVPGWGQTGAAIAQGALAYSVTYALGSSVHYYFERGGEATQGELQKVFVEKMLVARQSYTTEKPQIKQLETSHGSALQALTAQLEKNEITLDEFTRKWEDLQKH
jgi:hypothetical protein